MTSFSCDKKRAVGLSVMMLTGLGLFACASETHELQPADFASTQPTTQAAGDVNNSATSVASSAQTIATPAATTAASATPATAPAAIPTTVPAAGLYNVDAMVGQVNGRAIYASFVFEPLEDQLSALGRTLPRGIFRERATALITARLEQIVADALILGQAERDLNEQELQGLRGMIAEKREELLRQYGRGSVSLTEETLLSQTGKGLDQTLSEFRQKMVVRRYLQQKLFPKINVTRKDIERYYNDHPMEFNPPAGRLIRIIRVSDAAAAANIEKLFSQGKSFADAARDRVNLYRREDGGLMPERAAGEKVFDNETVNKAMLALAAGQHSEKIAVGSGFWWVFVESIEAGKKRTLTQCQLEIEETLRKQRYQLLTQQYRAKLFNEGSYNPIPGMTESLVQVAISRYATTTSTVTP